MPGQVNANYSANYEKFVDFANKAYATKGQDTVARFTGMPKGDYKGLFASFARSAEMKTANDQVRDLFRRTIADMFGGEKFIPDIVRDNMKLEDFGKGKPLTARRINLVKIAIDSLGGGKFNDPASIGRATAMGYVASELPKLARVANIYQQATGCTDAEAESAALDPNSTARRLFDCGGRFTLNADNFKKGLAMMDKFAGWFANMHDDVEAGKLDTPTKLNVKTGLCTRKAEQIKELSDKLFLYFWAFNRSETECASEFEALEAELLFEQLIGDCIPAMEAVGLRISTDLSAIEPYDTVRVRIDCLRRVADNIFDNMTKYADRSSPVTITATRQENCLTISFTNAVRPREESSAGTRIGVKTCVNMMEMMKGRFDTETDGRTFTASLSLPLAGVCGR
jgi:hypothetical protein